MSKTKIKSIASESAKVEPKVEPVKEAAAVAFAGISLTQDRLDKIESAFMSAKGRLQAAATKAADLGILKIDLSWIGSPEIMAKSGQSATIANKLHKAGLISDGDRTALIRYMALRHALTFL